MSSIQIEQADGGYLITTRSGGRVKVVVSFSEVVQFLAGHFGEKKIGEDWKP